ncbi:MAG: type sorting protein [Ferruginibacter sp.]|nr:type sorting protein [Ferruginibacter sp.]
MRKALLFLLCCSAYLGVYAKHVTGGEIIYDYLGPAGAGKKNYRITLSLFRDQGCDVSQDCAQLPTSVIIGIFNNDDNSVFTNQTVSQSSTGILPLNPLPPCITNTPVLNYRGGYYTFTITLPDNNEGYTLAYQTCCRVDNIMNVPNQTGATYTTRMPGKNQIGTGNDSSPRFSKSISVICYNKKFSLDFSATDPNADSLVYMFCSAFESNGPRSSTPVNPTAPPYTPVSYSNFGGTSPLGPLAIINPRTGIISGVAPSDGKYVVSVCVQSYRGGKYVSEHRKDFIINVAPCDFGGADLPETYINCDSLSVKFANLNTSPANLTYEWDFGDGTTSTEVEPTHAYADTGVYTLKLVINRGGSCPDSSTSIVRVFPGFAPAFTENSPMCKGLPVQFRDITTATYGSVNFWEWTFGDPGSGNNTSSIRTPTHSYAAAGTYPATLIVASSKGCRDTLKKDILIVDKPEFTISRDTLICTVDTLQLMAAASVSGMVTWSPNYMINDVNSFTPLVSPNVTTAYEVLFTDPSGCSARDTVTVRVVNNVTLQGMADTTICRTDSVVLRLNSDALYYNWTPAATLNDPSVKNPVATPTANSTTYRVRASISNKCFRDDDVTVGTIPYPIANAGADTTICFGSSAFLHATGGSIYSWAPRTYLTAFNSANTESRNPQFSMRYIVTVTDVLGCPKPVKDSMIVNVVRVIADAGPRDTSVVIGQPLQLNGTGGTIYAWSPSRWLSDANIANPVALPEDNIRYALKVSNDIGCVGYDSINVKLYKVDPDIFVPTAFSPQADGLNDVFRPIPIGIKSLESFRVYNRWGQLLFSTKQIGEGWNGKLGGADQGAGTYVWYAEATDYRGKKITKKGSVILIR